MLLYAIAKTLIDREIKRGLDLNQDAIANETCLLLRQRSQVFTAPLQHLLVEACDCILLEVR
jgi:hypothetical protein